VIRTKQELPVYPQRPRFWRSLEELEGIERREETSQEALAWAKGMDRRELFKFGGVSLALAGLTACTRQPTEKIIPYVRQPEEIKPGTPLFFATAMPLSGYATGLLVESHMGRPTKVEGNPLHPASLGATDLFSQASIYGLYDPDRSQSLTYLGEIRAWPAFLSAMRLAVEKAREKKGAGLRILTETVGSPTLGAQLRALLMELPEAKWHQWEPANRDNAWAGAAMAFGQPLDPVLDVSKADVILSLDADFFSCGPGHLKSVADFAARRRTRNRAAMNRLYCVEAAPGVTGASADHRLPMRASQVEAFARTVAALVGGGGGGASSASPFAQAVAEDLKAHRGKSLVVAGDYQPPAVHAIAHALNDALGNTGQTVSWIEPIPVKPESHADSFRRLVADMESGAVETLVIVGGNPAFTAPGDLGFAKALDKVKVSAHLSLHQDETSTLCRWHVPEAHYLESWSDARAFDGTASILQPLIAPLYGGKTVSEMLAVLAGQAGSLSHELVRSYWRGRFETTAAVESRGNFESWWQTALHDGVIADSRSPQKTVSLRTNWMQREQASQSGEGLQIVFRPDPTIHDGRFANNGWLQELPKPLSKLTWGNAIHLSPATAVRLGFAPADRPEQANEQEAELSYQGRAVAGPLLVVPGHPDDVVTVHLGHGRTRAGRLSTGVGFDANALRTWEAPWFGAGAALRLTGRRHPLARTQHHHLMENRDLVRMGTPTRPPEMPRPPRRSLTLYNDAEHLHAADQWGMVIDQSLCTGCSACIVACQAENNIPVVGKDQVQRGREMHWLRVDSYYHGASDNPATYFQPVPCMHCENAPCELVCPVGATVHSSDGLNDMVYNRCVGTRYCSNNCPYKVRRFNFYEFADWNTTSLRLLRNPEVTVRSRGVMEKCTYCVQRIRAGQIQAGREDRAVRDGEVVTACQSACPAGAIVFGNLADRASKVAQLQEEPYRYSLLADLNTRPRTTYLAAFRNPNPELLALEAGE